MLIMSRLLICLLFVSITACQPAPIGSQFLKEVFAAKEGYDGAINRLESYPLEEQWQIFLYANQGTHPPLPGLALPIAKQGKPALDYILEQLEQPNHELDVRDSLVVFDRMQRGGYYDVCGDDETMEVIRKNAIKISDQDWRDIYNRMLGRMC
jgi:hypothetical protein